ncbi:MAG: type III-B CRISPR module RAMP protein Cmr1 [Gammaproteobacteria bacterium]|nr:type III-B CRISPR module RAMP protein Cmr1 [Gammaproteobacteria bacterium]MBU1723885.1 type III-B CRISPR module RAMP protein Cmr1 [Gammaproteobacteria bacterium]MBU2006206.1 type III-B CRISPR module RAMP protein Cmr1 [Gammaproteobacteria bacterium]
MSLKFTEPHVIRATYRIVTPMFIGDAEQKASGISPASVKGALRFWWRALMWGKIRADFPDDASALKCLHCQEGSLFGSSADKGNAAAFTLRVTSNAKAATLSSPQPGIIYLLGQGLYRNVYLRPALALDATLKVELHINSKTEKQTQADYDVQNEQLVQALFALGLLGGLGSRARKGFGSLSIESLTNGKDAVAIPKNVTELTTALSSWKCTVGLPPFTAISSQARIDVATQGTKPLDVLNKVGEEQQLYRSYGQKGKVGKKDAEQNFRADHDLVAKIIDDKKSPSNIPDRSVFGLPHNYFFSSTKKKADFAPAAKERTRRASPLFIHTHQFPDKKVAVIQTLLPATFLPQGDNLEFKVGSSVKVLFNEKTMIDWQVIHTYMDRFAEKVRVL